MSHPVPTDSEVMRSRRSLRAHPAEHHFGVESEGPPIRRPRLDHSDLTTGQITNQVPDQQSIPLFQHSDPQPIHYIGGSAVSDHSQVGFK